MNLSPQALKDLLDSKVAQYNQKAFIEDDPISIPHLFSKKQDIEIAGFFAAILAWGRRSMIIKKNKELLQLMDNSPYQFIVQHQSNDLKSLLGFKHRTFQATDLLYFVHFLRTWYQKNASLETAFSQNFPTEESNIGKALIQFHQLFTSLEDFPARTRKHIATPARQSACKRLCMFLRWMVRKDTQGVDFGIWNDFKMSQLVCPCDVHVERVARKLGLITHKTLRWKTALELTQNLQKLDAQDPVKYDFALFGLGLEGY